MPQRCSYKHPSLQRLPLTAQRALFTYTRMVLDPHLHVSQLGGVSVTVNVLLLAHDDTNFRFLVVLARSGDILNLIPRPLDRVH